MKQIGILDEILRSGLNAHFCGPMLHITLAKDILTFAINELESIWYNLAKFGYIFQIWLRFGSAPVNVNSFEL